MTNNHNFDDRLRNIEMKLKEIKYTLERWKAIDEAFPSTKKISINANDTHVAMGKIGWAMRVTRWLRFIFGGAKI